MRSAPGGWADLLALDGTSVDLGGRTGDAVLDSFVFAAGDRCVRDVWAAGRHMVRDGQHIRKDRDRRSLPKNTGPPARRDLTDRKTTWQDIRTEVLRRIHSRDWPPGSQIPNEADLAVHFGCARATVNRALRDLAETGLLERRRKSGTRVALHPVRTAKLSIPMIRQESRIGARPMATPCLARSVTTAPATIHARMRLGAQAELLHLRSLHLADGTPHMVEDRWINLAIVPDAANAPFDKISANEWLLTHTPYTHGDIAFAAVNATDRLAEVLGVDNGAALFEIERTTWDREQALTTVKQVFAPGFRLRTSL